MNLLYITLALVIIHQAFAARPEPGQDIRQAFIKACKEGDRSTIVKLHKNHAILPSTYGYVLRTAYDTTLGRFGPTFKWLLAHADESDLQNALERTLNNETPPVYGSGPPQPGDIVEEKEHWGEKFKNIINEALENLRGQNITRIEKEEELEGKRGGDEYVMVEHEQEKAKEGVKDEDLITLE